MKHFEKIIGAESEEKRQQIEDNRAKIFKDQNFAELDGKEREKTDIEKKLIDVANRLVDDLRESFSIEKFTIPLENIHVINAEAWEESMGSINSRYAPQFSAILIGESEDKEFFLRALIHEMVHFKSYQAIQVTTEKVLQPHRIGLQTRSRDGSKEYLSIINEAVTEEISQELADRAIDDPRLNDIFPPSDELSLEKKSDNRQGEYLKEREALQILIDKIMEKSSKDFNDKKEIFDLFVRASIQGSMFGIGKVIEKTFGKGKFKEMGLIDDVHEFYAYVEKL